VFFDLARRDRRKGLAIASAGALAALVFLLVNVIGFGKATTFLERVYDCWNVNDEYENRLLDWPFRPILSGLADPAFPALKKAYVGLHVAFVTAAVAHGIARWREPPVSAGQAELWRLMTAWAALMVLFLSSLGSRWGWGDFPRYLSPVYPAAFWLLGRFWPRSRAVDAALVASSFVGAGLLYR
jgi:hypothetical protein